jgi:hypothetical protein
MGVWVCRRVCEYADGICVCVCVYVYIREHMRFCLYVRVVLLISRLFAEQCTVDECVTAPIVRFAAIALCRFVIQALSHIRVLQFDC